MKSSRAFHLCLHLQIVFVETVYQKPEAMTFFTKFKCPKFVKIAWPRIIFSNLLTMFDM